MDNWNPCLNGCPLVPLFPCSQHQHLAARTTNVKPVDTFHFNSLSNFFLISAAAQCQGSSASSVNGGQFSSFTSCSDVGTPSRNLRPLCSQFSGPSCIVLSLVVLTSECLSSHPGGRARVWWNERHGFYQTSLRGRDRGELTGWVLFSNVSV